jgi:integrase
MAEVVYRKRKGGAVVGDRQVRKSFHNCSSHPEKLTGRVIDAIVPTGSKLFTPDSALPGLFLRVTAQGAKSFVLRRQHEGARFEHTIGRADELTPEMARAKAAEILGAMRLTGHNPVKEREERIQKEKVAKANTIESLIAGYLANQDPKKSRRAVEDERYRFERYIIPRIGRRPYAELRRADLVTVIREIGVEVGGTTANRCHQYLSQLFNYALNGGAVEFNPIAGLPKQFKERKRARSLTEQELAILWRACEAGRAAPRGGGGVMPKTARAVQLVMLTLQRGHQIREMRRGDVSLERKEWIVPADRMKNRTPFLVPLSDPACAILAEPPRLSRRLPIQRGWSPWNRNDPNRNIRRSCVSGLSGW